MVPAARWLVVALLALAVCAPAIVLRVLPASDTDVAAPVLAQRMRATIDTGWSGEVRTQGSLSVPLTGSTFGGVARLLGESSQLRVWWQDDKDWRVDRISSTGETDHVRHDGFSIRWRYEDDTARLVRWSPIRLPDDNDIVPVDLARRLLAGAKPGELSRIAPRRVAGRSAAGLRLVPSNPASTIGRVDVWADESTNVPLRIDVYGAGVARHPVLSSEVTTFDDESPSDRALRLEFSRNVDFHRSSAFDSVAAANAFAPFLLPMRVMGLERQGDPSVLGAVGVYGQGPTAVLVVPLRDSTAEPLHKQLARSRSAQVTDRSAALEVGPLSVLLVQGLPAYPNPRLHDGGNFLLMGTITPVALRQAAVELQNGVLRTQ
jgi:hypothetical protein